MCFQELPLKIKWLFVSAALLSTPSSNRKLGSKDIGHMSLLNPTRTLHSSNYPTLSIDYKSMIEGYRTLLVMNSVNPLLNLNHVSVTPQKV
jgi:hypothetical protein